MGHLLKLKCAQLPLNPRILSSTSVPFRLTTLQVPNLALTHTKRITVLVCAAIMKGTVVRDYWSGFFHDSTPPTHKIQVFKRVSISERLWYYVASFLSVFLPTTLVCIIVCCFFISEFHSTLNNIHTTMNLNWDYKKHGFHFNTT